MMIPPPLSDYKERPLIHVSTDKPFYRQNEVVYIEAFLVDSISKKPLFSSQFTRYPQLRYEPYSYLDVKGKVEIQDSFGNKVHEQTNVKLYNGTFVFSKWKIPKE